MFKKSKIGFKVVQESSFRHNSFLSAIAWISSVDYVINKWAKPRTNKGPLAVFDTYRNASNFMRNGCGLTIFRCKYKESKIKRLFDGVEVLMDFCCPYGTRFADKVKILEKV